MKNYLQLRFAVAVYTMSDYRFYIMLMDIDVCWSSSLTAQLSAIVQFWIDYQYYSVTVILSFKSEIATSL